MFQSLSLAHWGILAAGVVFFYAMLKFTPRRNVTLNYTPATAELAAPPPPRLGWNMDKIFEEDRNAHFARELADGAHIWEMSLLIAGHGEVKHTVAKLVNPALELVEMMSSKNTVTFSVRAYPETATYRVAHIKGVSAKKIMEGGSNAD